MSEDFINSIICILIVSAMSLVFWIATTNERMAKQGFMPYKITGSSDTFWYMPRLPVSKKDPLEAF